MSPFSSLLRWMRAKDFSNLDSVESTNLDAARIKAKPVLRRIYLRKYGAMAAAMEEYAQVGDGPMLELGSGGGFFRDVLPGLTTSDIKPLDYVDQVEDAESLSFEDGTLRAIFAMHVFHHIPQVRRFLSEVVRCLKPGGTLVMIEPNDGFVAKFFFTRAHPEPFDRERADWSFPSAGPASGSNQAMAYLVFKRDRNIFEDEFPELELTRIRADTLVEYLASGGVLYRQLLPRFCFPLLRLVDWLLTPAMPLLGLHQLIVVRKRLSEHK